MLSQIVPWRNLMARASKRTHRIIEGIGHNLPQDTSWAFAGAVVELGGS
jgi:hypothetical protein